MKNDLEYKKCKCPRKYWEIIVVDKDEKFRNKTTTYYHCDFCGVDFLIKDFTTNKIMFSHKEKDDGCF